MRASIVSCSRHAPGARNIYFEWVGSRAKAPTSEWVCDLPAPVGLDGLAGWLAEHVYNASRYRGALMVRVYNDNRTEADILREQQPQNPHLANIIRAYELDKKPATIDDWLFPRLLDGETPEAYWQRAAAQMLEVGATRVAVDAPLKARVQWVKAEG